MCTLAPNRCPPRGSSALLLLLSHALQVVARDAEPRCFNHRPACVGAAPAYHAPAAGHVDTSPCAFVGVSRTPWSRRRQYRSQKTREPFSAPVARRRGRAVFCGDGQERRPGSTTTPAAAGSSPAGPSSQSPAEPAADKEPPEEIQYGFWAPASKELQQYGSRAPTSKAESFGEDSTVPSHVRRSIYVHIICRIHTSAELLASTYIVLCISEYHCCTAVILPL